MGEIKLANAEIGKQKTATAEYQHSFLIRTTADDGDTDTILCASSDASRDDWIRALTRKATSAEAMTKSSRRKSLPQPLESLGLTEPVPPRQRLTRPKPTGSDSPLSSSPSIPDHDSLPSSTPQSASLPLPEFASLPLHELPDSSRSTSRFVVSGPTNASPLPPGYDFKSDSRSREQQEKDRKGKTKSSFWGFNRNTRKSFEYYAGRSLTDPPHLQRSSLRQLLRQYQARIAALVFPSAMPSSLHPSVPISIFPPSSTDVWNSCPRTTPSLKKESSVSAARRTLFVR